VLAALVRLPPAKRRVGKPCCDPPHRPRPKEAHAVRQTSARGRSPRSSARRFPSVEAERRRRLIGNVVPDGRGQSDVKPTRVTFVKLVRAGQCGDGCTRAEGRRSPCGESTAFTRYSV